MATTKGKLLTQKERILCEKIVALNIVLVSQRAQALLLLDDGHTQVKSSELSSITIGQLRYLLRLFKKKGVNLFPPIPAPEPEPEISGKDVEKNKKKEKKKKRKKDKKTPAKKMKNSKKKEKKKTAKSKKKTKKGKKKR